MPKVNPVKLVSDLAHDIPEGINAARNPGLDPLPGWTDPLQAADAAEPEAQVDGPTTVAATEKTASKPARKPLVRLSPIARPGEGLGIPGDDRATEPERRPSLRSALGITGHPVRDFAQSALSSMRNALRQDDKTPDKKSTPATNDAQGPRTTRPLKTATPSPPPDRESQNVA